MVFVRFWIIYLSKRQMFCNFFFFPFQIHQQRNPDHTWSSLVDRQHLQIWGPGSNDGRGHLCAGGKHQGEYNKHRLFSVLFSIWCQWRISRPSLMQRLNALMLMLSCRAPHCWTTARSCSLCSLWRGEPLTYLATSASCPCSTLL